jgi:hypothetical protein
MNRAISLFVLAAMVAAFGSGCATKIMMQAAGETTRQKIPGVVRIVSAFRDADVGYLCIHRIGPDTRVETYWILIPIADTLNLHFAAPDDQPAVIKLTAEQVKPGACKVLGESMAVIELVDQDKLELGAGQKEAVYVQYAEDGVQSLGYVSTKPFFNRTHLGKTRHSYAIDLSETAILSKRVLKWSYLVVLLPLTVAADVAIGVGYGVFFIASDMVHGCSKTPGGCTWGR